jgi:HK97 family phage prohead protease
MSSPTFRNLPMKIQNNMEKRKYTQGYVRALPKDDSREVEFIVSNESIDRHNSIVKLDGWDLSGFNKNPILGWDHDVYGGWRSADPDNILGSIRVERQGDELVGVARFEDADTNKKADKIFKKIKNGTLNAVSVGFMPGESHEGDPDEREDEIRGVTYYDSAELVEVSVVPIPSNKDAVKRAIDNGDIPELIEDMMREALGDEYNEKLTLKGIFSILKGGEAEKIEEEETLKEVDKEDRDRKLEISRKRNDVSKLIAKNILENNEY